MTDIELLPMIPLPKRPKHVYDATYTLQELTDCAKAYARANVEHHTERLQAEVERLRDCLKTANSNHEQFERKWYLAQDRATTAESQRDMLAEALRRIYDRHNAETMAAAREALTKLNRSE